MKNVAKWLFVLAIASLIAAPSLDAQGKSNKKVKVEIIHNGHIISVAPEAVPAHLAHGDQLVNPPPPPTEYTVTVTLTISAWLDDGFGNLVLTVISTQTYTQSVAAGGSCTFNGILPEVVTLDSSSGATFTWGNNSVDVTDVQSNATAEFSSLIVDGDGGVIGGS